MSDRRHAWPADRDLERADELLDQADAFLRRHRAGFADAASANPDAAEPAATELDPFDDEDLPILTDVVDDYDLAPAATAAVDSTTPPASIPEIEPAPASAVADGTDATAARARTVIDRLADARSRQFAAHARSLADEARSFAATLIDGSTDSAVARAVEAWLIDELPQILARELAQLSFRVNNEVSTGLRAAIRQALADSAHRRAATAAAADSQGDAAD